MSNSITKLSIVLDICNVLLVIVIFYTLWSPSDSLLPILQPKDDPTSIHLPHAAEHMTIRHIQTVGSYTNVEDVMRYLHEHPEILANNPTATTQLQQMQQTQQALFATEEELQKVERQLNEQALQLYQRLSPTEREQIEQNRNIDSVQKIEAKYWEEVLDSPPPAPPK